MLFTSEMALSLRPQWSSTVRRYATEFVKLEAARYLHELAREQKAGLGVPVLHALVVGIKSVN